MIPNIGHIVSITQSDTQRKHQMFQINFDDGSYILRTYESLLCDRTIYDIGGHNEEKQR